MINFDKTKVFPNPKLFAEVPADFLENFRSVFFLGVGPCRLYKKKKPPSKNLSRDTVFRIEKVWESLVEVEREVAVNIYIYIPKYNEIYNILLLYT